MAFTSPFFLFFFLPLVLLLHRLQRRETTDLFLLLVSLFFYAWGEGAYVLVLLLALAGNYVLGRRIGSSAAGGGRWFVLGIVFNLAILASFKYVPVFFPGTGLRQPIGVSFFTFQAITYLIAVRRGLVPAQRHPLRLGLAIALFPQITAGPIVRYADILPQIENPRRGDAALFSRGVQRFIVGLAKKMVLANTLAIVADAVFAVPAARLGAGLSWLGLVCYTLQIFFDFSGYTDMAVGLGAMFGFTYPENFRYPYIARSLKDFWSRWHISLTSWLRDYVFLPLAYAVSRRIRGERWLGLKAESWSYHTAMLATMALCGVWHGAAWTFLLWGVWLGLGLSVEQAFLGRRLKRAPRPVGHLWTMAMVMGGWVFFRSPDLAYALGFFQSLFGFGGADPAFYPALYFTPQAAVALVAALPGCGPLLPAIRRRLEERRGTRLFGAGLEFILLAATLALSLLALAVSTYTPFIYFRF